LKFGELRSGFGRLPSMKYSLLFVDRAIVIALFPEPNPVPSKAMDTRSKTWMI